MKSTKVKESVEITQEQLKEVLNYDPNTGIFTWAKQVGQRGVIGKPAGSLDKAKGYISIKINRKKYAAHRLAWLYFYGYMPKDLIDHEDGIKDNNRIKNF